MVASRRGCQPPCQAHAISPSSGGECVLIVSRETSPGYRNRRGCQAGRLRSGSCAQRAGAAPWRRRRSAASGGGAGDDTSNTAAIAELAVLAGAERAKPNSTRSTSATGSATVSPPPSSRSSSNPVHGTRCSGDQVPRRCAARAQSPRRAGRRSPVQAHAGSARTRPPRPSRRPPRPSRRSSVTASSGVRRTCGRIRAPAPTAWTAC